MSSSSSSPAQRPPSAADPVAGKTVAEILGEIVWLMTQDPAGREMKVGDIERLVMPAILQRQFHIRYAQVPSTMQLGEVALQPASVDIYSRRVNGEGQENAKDLVIAFCFKSPKI